MLNRYGERLLSLLQRRGKTATALCHGVQQCRRAGPRLLQAEFLVARGQFVERLAAADLSLAAPVEYVFGADAAVRADLPAA